MHIRPATLSDLSTTSTIAVSAFWNDELYGWLYTHKDKYPEHVRDSILQKHRRRYWYADYVIYVAETDEEDKDWSGKPQVIGYAIWQRRGDSEAAKAWQKWSWRARTSHTLSFTCAIEIDKAWNIVGLETALLECEMWYHDLLKVNQAVDHTRLKHYLASGPEKFKDISDFWKLRDISTDPAFQRRGVASMLLEWAQKQAAQERCPVGLTASVIGQQLYRANGFRAYGFIPCEGFMDIPMFLWEPPGMEGWWGTKGDGMIKGQPEGKHSEDAF